MFLSNFVVKFMYLSSFVVKDMSVANARCLPTNYFHFSTSRRLHMPLVWAMVEGWVV